MSIYLFQLFLLERQSCECAHLAAHHAYRLGGCAVPVHVHDGLPHALCLHDCLGLGNLDDVLRPRLLLQPLQKRRAHAEAVPAVDHDDNRGLRVLRHKSGFKLHTMAKNGVQGSVHERRNAQIGIACQAHAASLLYAHPHPTAARRAATLASSGCEMHKGARTSLGRFRGVLRHEKKPEGYTEYPNGLKTSQNAKYSVSHQWERKGDAVRRPQIYTQAQTRSWQRTVRRFLFWWRRGESNSGPY